MTDLRAEMVSAYRAGMKAATNPLAMPNAEHYADGRLVRRRGATDGTDHDVLLADLRQRLATAEATVADAERVLAEVAPLETTAGLSVLAAEAVRQWRALLSEQRQVDQILGAALGYPKAHPDASDVDDGSVVTGEHTVVTLAQAAAERIRELGGKS